MNESEFRGVKYKDFAASFQIACHVKEDWRHGS
jgi:hypothetical protein